MLIYLIGVLCLIQKCINNNTITDVRASPCCCKTSLIHPTKKTNTNKNLKLVKKDTYLLHHELYTRHWGTASFLYFPAIFAVGTIKVPCAAKRKEENSINTMHNNFISNHLCTCGF